MIIETKSILLDLNNKKASIISLAGVALVFLFAYGCQPKTQSLIEPDKKVNRQELLTELEILKLKFEDRTADLDKQEQIRDIILNQSIKIASGEQLNPVGILTSALAVFGAGASVDNVRLRRQRKNDLQNKSGSKA